MTRKNYVAAAAKRLREESFAADVDLVVTIFVRFFQENNPRFDEKRFREACGQKEYPGKGWSHTPPPYVDRWGMY